MTNFKKYYHALFYLLRKIYIENEKAHIFNKKKSFPKIDGGIKSKKHRR